MITLDHQGQEGGGQMITNDHQGEEGSGKRWNMIAGYLNSLLPQRYNLTIPIILSHEYCIRVPTWTGNFLILYFVKWLQQYALKINYFWKTKIVPLLHQFILLILLVQLLLDTITATIFIILHLLLLLLDTITITVLTVLQTTTSITVTTCYYY